MQKDTFIDLTDAENCPVRNVLANVSGKWRILILALLCARPHRFSEIKRSIGEITQRVLTQSLREMERDGFVIRDVDPGPPVAVTYSLTPIGRELAQQTNDLSLWAQSRFGEIKEARAAFDSR